MEENRRRLQNEPKKQSARRPVKRTAQGEKTPVRKKKKKGCASPKRKMHS